MRLFFIFFLTFLLTNCFAQSTFDSELKYTSSKTAISSWKNSFSFLDDTIFNQTKKIQINIAPNSLIAFENDVFKSIFGAQVFGKYVPNSKLRIDFSNISSITNTRTTRYQAVLQTKSFFQWEDFQNDLRTRITFTPNSTIQLEGGLDKELIGEGDRSMLIDNQGIANPFVKLKVNFWKFEYTNTQQILREGTVGHYTPKGNSIHYFNFNHKNKFSIGIFESVTHLIKDTIYNRGYELEYLNPLILYRPQEYSLGSTDNVILGLNSFIGWKKSKIYGQISLDDFNVQELRNKSKWWANKYGIQLGFKSFFNLFSKQFFFRTELNRVTPYTYSAIDNNTNYGNQGLTMAHPLGSNFIESYSELLFNFKAMHFHIWLQYYMKGFDPKESNFSYGADIYKSYNSRPFGDYGYFIGVGDKKEILQIGGQISRNVSSNKWKIFIEPRCYFNTFNQKTTTSIFLTAGIQSRLFQDKRNY